MPKEPASSCDRHVVSKGAFAEIIGVTPGRVSQYLKDGQIGPDALVGEGRRAKIDVEVAKAQLKETLDINQRMGNGLETNLDKATPPAASEEPQGDQSPRGERFEDKIKHEKLLKIQRENRREAEQDALRAGQLVLADQAREQAHAIASRMMQTFEGSLSDMAAAISTQFKLPHRDVVHCMRLAFNDVRARASTQADEQAQNTPAVVEAVIQQDAVIQ